MELDKNLLQYTVLEKINLVPLSDTNIEVSISDISKVNLYPVGGRAIGDVITVGGSDVDLFGNISDDELLNLYADNTKLSTQSNNIKFATTYKNFTPEEISNIKRVIYDLHKSGNLNNDNSGTVSIGGATGGSGTGAGGSGGMIGGSETGAGGSGTAPVNKKSFLADFCDVDTMFDYLELLSGGEVTKDTGITRAQLVHLTQNEVWEENNSNFWGTLNRIFNVLDTDSTKDVLSYDEIKSFIGEELGEDVAAYLNKVNSFTKQLQTEYMKLSDQGKLEFVIDRTREYLEAAGLDKQLNALDRLTSETDTYNTSYSAKVGQIVMAIFQDRNDGYITLGAYSSRAYPWSYNDKEDIDNPFTVHSFAWDTDGDDFDGGITLNEYMLSWDWYFLVDTLVHELTHATASQWYPNPPSTRNEDTGFDNINFDFNQVKALKDAGVLTDAEYDFYRAHWETMFSANSTEEEDKYFYRLMYLLECQWGEYAAYQIDADYVDSIAGDVFNKSNNTYGNKSMTTAVSGVDEADIISSHIEKAYNNDGMSIEDYARDYGYDISEINDYDGNGIVSYGDYILKDGKKIDIYSKESKPDYDWATYDKNQNWTWVV